MSPLGRRTDILLQGTVETISTLLFVFTNREPLN
jgi:hypothetical protein